MKISIITVCVDYCQEMSHCYESNKEVYSKHDYWTITTPSDQDTINFCKDNNIHTYQTNAFYEVGTFNKARSINQFFLNTPEVFNNDWILLTDSDMICADALQFWINEEYLRDPISLYSARREFILDDGSIRKPLVDDLFYGFFQLFHKQNILPKIEAGKNFLYENHNAGYYDFIFKQQFKKFVLLEPPEPYYPHLIHYGTPGKYWDGKNNPQTN